MDWWLYMRKTKILYLGLDNSGKTTLLYIPGNEIICQEVLARIYGVRKEMKQ